jgi:thiol-disulfide isomerase/thioredoxin
MKWTRPDLWMALALASFTAATSAGAAQTPEAAPTPVLLKAGETVPPFEATGINGEIREVKYKGPTVLVFFLSSCPVCHKMIPEWNQAFERKPAGLEVVGVLMDREPPGFFAVTPVTFPVVRSPSREFSRIFKVARVPITLRVAPGGKVEDIALGILDPIRLGEFFRR